MQRRSFKHMLSFAGRLEREGRSLKHPAHKIRRGKEREMLLRKASQLETAVQINEWLSNLQASKDDVAPQRRLVGGAEHSSDHISHTSAQFAHAGAVAARVEMLALELSDDAADDAGIEQLKLR